jgi:hypothetical protein
VAFDGTDQIPYWESKGIWQVHDVVAKINYNVLQLPFTCGSVALIPNRCPMHC